MVCVLIQIWARDSRLNNWEHRGEGMYCPRALLKILGSGTTFFCVKDPPVVVFVSLRDFGMSLRNFTTSHKHVLAKSRGNSFLVP